MGRAMMIKAKIGSLKVNVKSNAKSWVISVVCLMTLCGCDPNSKATYGDTGLPKNCRAIVQANIDSYRAKEFTADEVMSSLERNCGENGYSWDQ